MDSILASHPTGPGSFHGVSMKFLDVGDVNRPRTAWSKFNTNINRTPSRTGQRKAGIAKTQLGNLLSTNFFVLILTYGLIPITAVL